MNKEEAIATARREALSRGIAISGDVVVSEAVHCEKAVWCVRMGLNVPEGALVSPDFSIAYVEKETGKVSFQTVL